MKTLHFRSAATILLTLVTVSIFSSLSVNAQMSNHIIKELPLAVADVLPPPPPPPVPAVPPILPGLGAGAGFHKNLDFSVGGGAGAGYGPLLAGLLPALGGLGAAVPQPPPVAEGPPPPGVNPFLGAPGYLGLPGFLGPSYIPYSWLGSALGAKGDLLFPVVIFIFVVVGTWTVVQFLLSLIVPLIAGKLAVGKHILSTKGLHKRGIPDPWDDRDEQLAYATEQVMPTLDSYANRYMDMR